MARKPRSPTPAQVAAQANEYLDAAREHLGRLQPLHDAGDYALCLYFAGLSIECALRAYRHRIDPQFSARHDLADLAKAAVYHDCYPAKRHDEMAAAMTQMAGIWSSNDRFRPTAAVRGRLRRLGYGQGRRRDFLRDVASTTMNHALMLVGTGIAKWQS